ncbi:transaldolase family protein [Luedemannella flava]
MRDACDIACARGYDASGGVDGQVSIEVDPRLAFEQKTIGKAEELKARRPGETAVHQDPATIGLAAIGEVSARAASVNVTLIFGLEPCKAVASRVPVGLELAAQRDLSRISSVASFFVSQIDTEVDDASTRSAGRGQGAQGQGRVRQRPATLPLRAGLLDHRRGTS